MFFIFQLLTLDSQFAFHFVEMATHCSVIGCSKVIINLPDSSKCPVYEISHCNNDGCPCATSVKSLESVMLASKAYSFTFFTPETLGYRIKVGKNMQFQ